MGVMDCTDAQIGADQIRADKVVCQPFNTDQIKINLHMCAHRSINIANSHKIRQNDQLKSKILLQRFLIDN